MKKWNLLLVLVLAMAMAFAVVGCSDDDDDDTTGPTEETIQEKIVGTWLSAGDDVAALLAADPFNYDSVLVVFNENLTVTLNSHVRDGAWSGEVPGTYVITESETGEIHSIAIDYTAFAQEGIFQIVDGTVDVMTLEMVQTVPDQNFVVPTPEAGFGATYTVANVQTYKRQ